MKSNSLIAYLLIVILVLAAVWAFKTYQPQTDSDSAMYANKWQKLTVDQVKAITVKSGQEELALTKDGLSWKAGEYPADNTMVNDLLQNLLQPAKLTVVAITGARHGELGVASESAVLVIGTDKPNRSVRLGNNGTGGRYVRFDDTDTVYLVPNLPALADSLDLNNWIDKTLLRISEDKITKLTVEGNKSKVTLVRQNGDWTKEGDSQLLDSSPFTPLTQALASLTTRGLVKKELEKEYAAKPNLTITVEQTDGTPVTLKFYPGNNDALAESSERAGRYVVPTTMVDSLTIDPAALKPLSSPTPTVKS
jgi:hypothetical protein